jgi:hypothetical protein
MKGKKGQLAYIIIIVIIIAMAYIFFKGYLITGVQANIGANQLNFIRAYHEGEQAREYIHGAARIAIYEEMSRQGCNNFNLDLNNFKTKMDTYIRNYESPYGFEATLPSYTYSFGGQGNSYILNGNTDDQIILEHPKLTYKLNGEIREVITCDEWRKFNEI